MRGGYRPPEIRRASTAGFRTIGSMGAFDIDTAVTGADGHYRARVSREWEIWGPNGGYLAVLALRAAGAHTDLRRPASFSCHFLGVADFDAVDLSVRTLRRTKRVESIAVSMTQRGAPILEAMVWVVGEVEGLAHDAWTMPEVPAARDCPTAAERMAAAGLSDGSSFAFWDNLEFRPCDWIDDWDNRPPGGFHEQAWYRFRPQATFDDPFVDAGRALLLLDTVLWPAAMRGHPENVDWYAPSIDVQARFHALVPDDEFLLTDVHSPAARDGLVGGAGSIWSERGVLLATGGQQMLCRPRMLNPNPDQR
jgi:acyl-CoA thioesterase